MTDVASVDACRGGVRNPGPPGKSLDLNCMFPGTLDPRITFTRASSATYFDNAGVMQTAATNAPRWDYDPATLQLRGLMIEEQRTNILLNSATLSTQSVTVTAQAYTLSFYGTGTVTKSGAATGALVGTGASQRVSQTFTPTAGTLTLTVTGSVLNAQIEAGSFSTSVIPTTSVAVTRAADVATMPTNVSWFNASAGSLLVDYDAANPGQIVSGFSDGGTSNMFLISQTGLVGATVSSVSKTVATSPVLPFPSVNKIAGNYQPGRVAGAANGGSVVADNTLASGPFLWTTRLTLGCSPWALDSPMGGHMRRINYWPRALSDAELQQVTT